MNKFDDITAVSDSSFIIGVSVSGQWENLKLIVRTLYVADAIWDEVVVRGKGKPGQKEIQKATFVERKPVSDVEAVTMLMSTLDKGEAETIILAKELGIKTVFIDDLRGRKIAQSVGLKTVGIAGFLLLAKNRMLIKEVRPYLLQLKLKGFRLSSKLINKILKSTGENSIM